VTMPTQAADAPDVTRQCLAGGMDVMRVNGAHDGPERWSRMIHHLREAERELGRTCRVQLDLPGPKIRTSRLADPDEPIPVRVGDEMKLKGPHEPCRTPLRDADGRVTHPALVGCSAVEALDALAVGDEVWFDDGKFGALVRSVKPGSARLEVTHAPPKGALLRGDKGINLPSTHVPIETPTGADLACLDFAAERADIVALSFVRSPGEIDRVREALRERGAPDLPILLKVETRQAFNRLPELLLALMRSPVSGVMIARGDLAVECGWERLAEAQEEILWTCEAAHMPVVWATQVLETLAKKGRPTRSEVTDAAMAERAEGVMLNKGPFIVEAMRALDGILGRMASHQHKKRAELRALGMARAFNASGE
jgi:pyruvate kinase